MKKKLSLLMALSMGVCSISSLSMTASAESTNEFKAEVRVYDSVTGETIENVNAKFITYDGLDVCPSREEVADEWNTSDSNPHYININIDDTDFQNWKLIVDNLPEGYSYNGHNCYESSYVLWCEDKCIDIPLDPIPPVELYDLPVQDTVTYSFNILDSQTKEPLEGVKVKLYEFRKIEYNTLSYWVKDKFAEWTYAQGDTVEIPVYINEFKNRSEYVFLFENLPENYSFRSDRYSSDGTGRIVFLDDNDKVCETMDKEYFKYFGITLEDYNAIKYNFEEATLNFYLTDQALVDALPPTFTELLKGDANCDSSTNIADATAIVQYIGNPDKYPLSEQGLKNADCYNTGDGITGMDAIAIQKLEAKQIDSL